MTNTLAAGRKARAMAPRRRVSDVGVVLWLSFVVVFGPIVVLDIAAIATGIGTASASTEAPAEAARATAE